MADDAWYLSIGVPSQSRSRKATTANQPISLEPSYAAKTDIANVEPIAQHVKSAQTTSGPPLASYLRRAKSYTDPSRTTRPKRQTLKNVYIDDVELGNKQGHPIRNEQDIDQWFDGLSQDLVESSHAKYRLYLEQLRLSRNHLDSLLSDTSTTLQVLSSLTNSFRAVELQTSTFQARCEGIVLEQRRLAALADGIGQNLQYYSLLDPITRRLNVPGAGQSVRREDFTQMLSNLDQCLDYMKAHPDQKEAPAYESRYRLLLTRALTLIRVHFTDTLRAIASDVARRIAEKQLTDTTTSALLYAKFRVGAPDLKRLGLEIQKRAMPAPGSPPGTQGEYQSLMNELYQSYSAARGRLLVPLVRKRLAEIAIAPKESKDLVALARTSIGYVRGLCMDEYELWHDWFDGENGLYEFLEAMCEPLFDYLRPRTVYETQLPKLCELCSIIQVRYMEDQDDEDEPVVGLRVDFGYLIRPALEDAQTRLVFLAVAALRDGIERYKPTAADLDCARKSQLATAAPKSRGPVLSGTKTSTNGVQPEVPKPPTDVAEDSDPFDMQWSYNTRATSSEWYPTLRKAIWLLSRIYRLVNSTVFDDLAHQIVHQTTLSLQNAASQIASKASLVDSQLFLLKQLLILKQQVVAFDIEYVTPEVQFDFSNITNTFWELRERGGLFDPRNILRLVGGGLMPRVIENMLDAKAELDGRLRTVINEFTNSYANRITSPVSQTAESKKDFNGPAAVTAIRGSIEKEVPVLRTKLGEYLDDIRIKETLVGAVQDRTLQQYEDFFDRMTAKTNGSVVPKKGKGREDDIWDPDTFADWTNTVFGVERLGPGMSYEDEESPTLSRSDSA